MSHALTLLEPQSRFRDKPVKFGVICPQNGTAVLKGLRPHVMVPLCGSLVFLFFIWPPKVYGLCNSSALGKNLQHPSLFQAFYFVLVCSTRCTSYQVRTFFTHESFSYSTGACIIVYICGKIKRLKDCSGVLYSPLSQGVRYVMARGPFLLDFHILGTLWTNIGTLVSIQVHPLSLAPCF